jgi:hypothetical protein
MPRAPAEAVPRRLPPPPRTSDWLAAGVWAGAALGCAEVALVALAGPPAPAGLAAVLVGGAALVVGALAGALGLGLARRRRAHSQMVGALAGPLLLGAGLGTSLETASTSALAGGVALGLTAASALAAGWVAGWVGRRLESAGQPLAGPGVWAALVVLLAVAQAPEDLASVRLLAAGGLGAAIALALVVAARRAPPRARSWPRRLGAVSLLAVAMIAGPGAVPWLLVDPALPPLPEGGPAHLVAVVWPTAPGVGLAALERESPTLALLTHQGLAWEVPGTGTGPTDATPRGLRDPEGRPLLARLARDGHVTAAVLTRPEADSAGAAEIDFRPGPGGYLAGPARRTTAGSLLRALGARRLGALDLREAWRQPGDATAAARRWLAGWRGASPDRPFALLVDYRRGGPLEAAALERELASLLDFVGETGALPFSAVLVWLDGPSAPASGTLRPPPAMAGRVPPRDTAHPADLKALGGLVLDVLASDGEGSRPGSDPSPRG